MLCILEVLSIEIFVYFRCCVCTNNAYSGGCFCTKDVHFGVCVCTNDMYFGGCTNTVYFGGCGLTNPDLSAYTDVTDFAFIPVDTGVQWRG